MEDKKLNEQESLELIARMIRNSKRNVRENAGGPALIGGYATVLTSLFYLSTNINPTPLIVFINTSGSSSRSFLSFAIKTSNVRDAK